jgi:hypothetical protein
MEDINQIKAEENRQRNEEVPIPSPQEEKSAPQERGEAVRSRKDTLHNSSSLFAAESACENSWRLQTDAQASAPSAVSREL